MGLLDFLGHAAIAGGSMLERENKAKDEAAAKAAENEAAMTRQKTMADYQADLAMKKQMLLEELAADREKRKRTEFTNAADQAETRSAEIGTDRRFQKFMEDGKQAGYFEGMSPEEIKGVFEQTYDDKRVNAQEGGDRYQDKTLAVKADDFVKASRETGSSGLLTQALNDRKTAIGQDNTRASEAFKEREAKRKEEADRVREEQRDKQLEIQNRSVTAAITRSGSSDKSDKPEKLGEIEKMELQDLRTELRDAQKAADSALGKKAKDAAQAKVDALKAEYNALKEEVNPKPRSESPKPSTSKPTGGQLPSLPAGARQIGTSGGKPVYQTPDGKKFIQR